MNKEQAYQSFWESFGIPAYDETSVPDDAELPYITYESATDDLGHTLGLTTSIWYRSTSWKEITAKKDEIESAISRGGVQVPYDGASFWIAKANPWCQRMADESSDMIRRLVLNVQVEFLE